MTTVHPPSPVASLLGAYLYQGWGDEYANVWDAVDDALMQARAEDIHAARDEVRALIAESPDEERILEHIVSCWRLDHWPPGDGQLAGAWIEQLGRRVASAS